MVHSVSMGMANGAVAAIPCSTDYQYIRTQIDTASIKDPKLREEVGRFQRACYGGARAKLMRENGSIGDDLAGKTDWLGSKYFLTTPGYYDDFQALKPVKGFTYVSSRDDGHGTGQAQGGYPSCKDWWTASKIGLHDRLHDQISPSLWNRIHGAFSSTDAEDYAIRGLLSHSSGGAAGNVGHSVGNAGSTSYAAGAANKVAGYAGVLLGAYPASAMKDVAARALPFVQGLVLMAIVIGMPFVIVFSGYGPKAVGLLTFAYFGTVTLSFWFELATYLQNNLIDMVYHSNAAKLGFIAGITSSYDTLILTIVEAALLILFPPLWTGMLGWAGYNAGSAVGSAMNNGSSEANKAGKKGVEGTQKAAAKRAGKK